MPLNEPSRFVASALAGVSAAVVVLSVVKGSSAGSLGVAAPAQVLLAGATLALCAGAAWVLLSGARSPSEALRSGYACPECGGGLRADWRLCPHCGELLAGEPIAREHGLRSGDLTS